MAHEKGARIVERYQVTLVTRQAAHRVGMPGAQRGAPVMPGDRLRHVEPRDPARRAACAEVHVFQIGLETLLEEANAVENLGAQKDGGPGR